MPRHHLSPRRHRPPPHRHGSSAGPVTALPGPAWATPTWRRCSRSSSNALVPGRAWRWEPRTHPYTLKGRQVDVRNGDEWVEVWECGLARADVLAGAGLDGWSGLPLGTGLDRLLMPRKGIPTSGSFTQLILASPGR